MKVIGPSRAPMSIDATLNAPDPVVLGRLTEPGVTDAAIDSISADCGLVAETRKVLSPPTVGAGSVLLQTATTGISWLMDCVGVTAKKKLWDFPAAMSTGVLALPVGAFVAGLVVWYLKSACTPAGNLREHLNAVTAPELMMVANAVTG